MRKEKVILKDDADIAVLGRDENAPMGVEEGPLAEADGARAGLTNAGDKSEDRALACAGGAEKGGNPGPRLKRGVQRKAREITMAAIEVESAHDRSPRGAERKRGPRRSSHSAAMSAAAARRIETTTRRVLSSMPPGAVDERIDVKRNGLGFSGNVARDHDRGAELAQAAGKSQHGAGNDPAAGQWQRDPKKCPQRSGAQRPGRFFEPHIDPRKGHANCPHHQRKGHDGGREGRSLPGEHEVNAEQRVQLLAEPAALPKSDQQQVSGHHGRQDERQADDRFDNRFATEFAPREQVPQEDAERQTDHRRR